MSTKASVYGSSNSLTMLVFSQASLAHEPVVSVENKVSDTTYTVTTSTIIIICAVIAFDLALIGAAVSYLASPLEGMRRISAEVVHMSAEDEENKDYSSLIETAFLSLNRTDEVGFD